MHQGVGKVSIAAEGADEAGRSITQIREGSGCVVGISDDISSALKEQRFASELIACPSDSMPVTRFVSRCTGRLQTPSKTTQPCASG